jgi:hypothetical protein
MADSLRMTLERRLAAGDRIELSTLRFSADFERIALQRAGTA